MMLTLALRYLGARKLRTLLTTLAVVFGVAVIFAGNLVLPGVLESFRRGTLGAAGLVDLSIGTRGGALFAPGPVLEQVRSLDGVRAATPVLQQALSLPATPGGVTPQAVIVGVDAATVQDVRVLTLAEGRMFAPAERGVVVLTQQEISAEQMQVGDRISLPGVDGLREFAIVGLLARRDVPSSDVLMPLADAQELLGSNGRVSTVEAALAPGTSREAVLERALATLGGDFQQGAGSAVDAVGSLDIGYAMFNMMGALALFIGAFLIFNSFQTAVLERRRDLAMLRAIGAERGHLTRLLLIESLLQGIIGSVLGLGVGALLAVLVVQGMRSVMQQFFGGTPLSIAPNLAAVVPALLAGIITTLLAGYLPARSAGRVTPLEALRPASASTVRRSRRMSLAIGALIVAGGVGLLLAGTSTAAGGAVLILVGLAVLSPALIVPLTGIFTPLLAAFGSGSDLARSNVERQPGRAAITASTLMIGLAVVVMLSATSRSFSVFTTDLFERNFASDMMLLPQNITMLGANVGANTRLAESLRALPGVAAVGTLRTASGDVGAQAITVQGIDPQQYPLVSALTFSEGDAATAYTALSQEGTAIANSITAAKLGLRIGDSVTVSSAEGAHTYRIVAIGSDALNFKINTLFISQQAMAKDFGRTQDMVLMLKLAPDADRAAVTAQVQQVAQNYSQFTVHDTATFRQSLLDQSLVVLQASFWPLALVILLPAGLGLLNTLTMNVLERTREIGVLRAIGASQRQVRQMILLEAVLLALFGALTGVLAGTAMSYGFLKALSGGFGMALPFDFPWPGIAVALLVGLLLTLAVSFLPARNAARLNMLHALRYE